jgi:hypothetical protein
MFNVIKHRQLYSSITVRDEVLRLRKTRSPDDLQLQEDDHNGTDKEKGDRRIEDVKG